MSKWLFQLAEGTVKSSFNRDCECGPHHSISCPVPLNTHFQYFFIFYTEVVDTVVSVHGLIPYVSFYLIDIDLKFPLFKTLKISLASTY